MSEHRKGIYAIVLCCTMWGFSPLYYAQLSHISALDVIAHRSVWAVLFFVAILSVQGRLQNLKVALNSKPAALMQFTAGLIVGLNWLGFVYAIGTGQTLEASFGYYIYPLMAVLFGRIYFKEKISGLKAVATTLAGIAALVLGFGLNVPPWLALGLALSFIIYSAMKKQSPFNPVVSVTAEILTIMPLALGWLIFFGDHSIGWQGLALLSLSGPITAIPLVLYSYAATRLHFSTTGILFYLNPTFQFICAVLFLGELFTIWHAYSFMLIWIAVFLYCVSLKKERSGLGA